MICGATEVYMKLWTGKVERVLVCAPLVDEIRPSVVKRIVVTRDASPFKQGLAERRARR